VFAAALLMLALRAQIHPDAKSSGPDYAALSRYRGTWRVSPANRPSGAKPDLLVNQCALVGSYFACQQTVNGKNGGLMIFIPADQPEHFYTQVIMPEGRATGRDDLEIAGDRWTYTSRRLDQGKTTFYKTTNTFQGRNKIHFEQADSTDGKQWTVRNSGDEVRVR
jgi:hypothetical protein